MYHMTNLKYIFKTKIWNRKISYVFIVSIFLFACIFMLLFPGLHHARAAKHQVLNFASVYVQSKDTLWGIAKKYYSEEYGSVNDYVKEIKRCNSLTNDYIQSGSFIIVPIYVLQKESEAVH